ncbi:type I-E CRISPR-associated protein Cas7/Cse4/CasC [Amycolatopsis magusensis]|uniref:type I-E CRISPR-associated protein Cas7/Cse4/CasC n=1 Tax=Amycolatopsis magusensis TaxID=882444 RepID=UPI0037A24A16
MRYLDIHILQTVPLSALNCDDVGEPKTATFGGVARMRISSQAWKYATLAQLRRDHPSTDWGVLTTRAADMIAEAMPERDYPRPPAQLAADLLAAAKIAVHGTGDNHTQGRTKAMLRIGAREADALAELLAAAAETGQQPAAREVTAALTAHPPVCAVLFGRMVAKRLDLRIDAAVSTAHAIGVSAAETTLDFYTAMDNLATDSSAAGFFGTTGFGSSTLYRYATVDLDRARACLGQDTTAIITAYLRAWITSMPSGRTAETAPRTLPHLVSVALREQQPLNLSTAFASALPATATATEAAHRLLTEAADFERFYNMAPAAAWTLSTLPDLAHERLGPLRTLDEIITGVAATLSPAPAGAR